MRGCSDGEMNDGNYLATDYGCVSRNDIKTARLTVQADHEMLKNNGQHFTQLLYFQLAAEQFVTQLYFRHIKIWFPLMISSACKRVQSKLER